MDQKNSLCSTTIPYDLKMVNPDFTAVTDLMMPRQQSTEGDFFFIALKFLLIQTLIVSVYVYLPLTSAYKFLEIFLTDIVTAIWDYHVNYCLVHIMDIQYSP